MDPKLGRPSDHRAARDRGGGWRGRTPRVARDEVRGRLVGRVAEAFTHRAGSHPGRDPAAACPRARAFVKAGARTDPRPAGIHRGSPVMAALPRSAPAPRLLWSLDRHGWVACLEDVPAPSPAYLGDPSSAGS